MDMTAAIVTLTSGQVPSGGPLPSVQEIGATVISLALSPTLSTTSPPVNQTNASLPPLAARDPTDMANMATPMSGTTAAGSCSPLAENPTTKSPACSLPNSGPSTGSSHHSVSSATPFPQPSTKPKSAQISSSILLSAARSSPRAVSEGSSPTPEKPPQSSFISTKSVISVRSTFICPAVSALADTTTQPLNSNSHISIVHGSPPSTGYSLPSQVACVSTGLSPITITHFSQETTTPMSPGTPGAFQGTPSISAPSSITSTELTTLADGTVLPMTQAMANSAQDASGSSPSHAFFGNHPVVVSVFILSGMVVAFIIVLGLRYCRRPQRKDQHDGEKIQDISSPLPQNHFTMREHVSPHGRWDGFVSSGDQHTPMRSTSSIPLKSGEDSMPATHAITDTSPPLPPPPPLQQQRSKSRLSYRVPVPYGSGVLGSNSQTADQQYMGPFSDYPPVPTVPKLTPPIVPPPPPKRSPLRLLATKNDLRIIPQDNTQRLSGASSLSLYTPSVYPSDVEVDSLYQKEAGISPSRDTSDSSTKGPSSTNNSGMEQREKASKNPKPTVLGGVDSDGVPLSWKRTLQR